MDASTLDADRIADSSALVASQAPLYTIGDLAREFDVTLRALRFYEDKGLLSPRREGLARLYSPAERARLGLILKGKKLGFTLSEIKAMVALREGTPVPAGSLALSREKCTEQLRLLEKQKADIEDAIGELRQMVMAFGTRGTA